jgi:hypothetical protein
LDSANISVPLGRIVVAIQERRLYFSQHEVRRWKKLDVGFQRKLLSPEHDTVVAAATCEEDNGSMKSIPTKVDEILAPADRASSIVRLPRQVTSFTLFSLSWFDSSLCVT